MPETDEALDSLAPEEEKATSAEEYYAIPTASRIVSILSLIASVLSILICPFYYVGVALGAVGVVLAVVSSVRLGYFDKLSLFGLILGIFGFIFSLFVLALDVSGVWGMIFGSVN